MAAGASTPVAMMASPNTSMAKRRRATTGLNPIGLMSVGGPIPTFHMNAARALKVARERAGLSQSELARVAGVSPSVVNRIERGVANTRVNTLISLLRAAGAELSIEARVGDEIDRGPIRELLAQPMRLRLPKELVEGLDELCLRRVRFVVIGRAASRLWGAPFRVERLHIATSDHPLNLRKLERLQQRSPIPDLIEATACGSDVWRDKEELPWLPNPRHRAMNRWIDEPTGFIASLDFVIDNAPLDERRVLRVVQQEIDAKDGGFRVYRDPDRKGRLLPSRPGSWRRQGSKVASLSRIDGNGNS